MNYFDCTRHYVLYGSKDFHFKVHNGDYDFIFINKFSKNFCSVYNEEILVALFTARSKETV